MKVSDPLVAQYEDTLSYTDRVDHSLSKADAVRYSLLLWLGSVCSRRLGSIWGLSVAEGLIEQTENSYMNSMTIPTSAGRNSPRDSVVVLCLIKGIFQPFSSLFPKICHPQCIHCVAFIFISTALGR